MQANAAWLRAQFDTRMKCSGDDSSLRSVASAAALTAKTQEKGDHNHGRS